MCKRVIKEAGYSILTTGENGWALMFVPDESTKDGKNKGAITKDTKWAECEKEGSMLYHSLSSTS